jgi:hypothetical protein
VTEREWINATDPQMMLLFLGYSGKASERKLELFSCAIVRRFWRQLGDERLRQCVRVAERFADGLVTLREMGRAFDDFLNAVMEKGGGFRAAEAPPAVAAAFYAVHGPSFSDAYASSDAFAADHPGEAAAHAALLRDLFGPLPFREVCLDLAWLVWNDRTVKRLAEGIYEERAFERMPVLGDALEEAGCESEDILRHCRERGLAHCRGCWAVDLILGKG